MTTEQNKAVVRRFFTLLAIVTILALTFATLSPSTVSAHQGHGSCAAYGGLSAAGAPHGEDARVAAPLNDEMAFVHAALCEPRP
jgi:hypothetical protein